MKQTLTYRSAPARRAQILDLLRTSAYLGQGELSQLLGVSEMTIRRDARELDERGLLRVVPGGVSSVSTLLAANEFALRVDRQVDAKRQIAAAAVGTIAPRSTIAIDAGTTALEIARLLDSRQPLTVVTASLPVMVVLGDHPGIEMIGLGGMFRARTQAFAGPATIDALRRLHVARLFLGAAAVDSRGTYEGNTWDSEIKRSLIDAADEVTLVVDSTKFARTAVARVCPLSAIHSAIVDAGISEADREMLEAAGVRVMIVPADRPTSSPGLPITGEPVP